MRLAFTVAITILAICAWANTVGSVVPLAAPHERSGLLSAVYVVSYLALGLPAVGGGFLVVHGGLLPAAREYGVAVMVLAAIALGAVARPSRRVVTAA